jgi:hypothetical protein
MEERAVREDDLGAPVRGPYRVTVDEQCRRLCMRSHPVLDDIDGTVDEGEMGRRRRSG